MEKYQENLMEASRHLRIADHMAYVTLPLVNEHRLLLKIFDEIYLSIINCINAILNYESLYKRIKIYPNFNNNIESFMKISRNYDLSAEQLKTIKEIIELNKKHKYSAIEFVKQNKIVIMSDNLNIQVLDVISIKKYLLTAKEIMVKAKEKIIKSIQ
jgi:hypothetical protein